MAEDFNKLQGSHAFLEEPISKFQSFLGNPNYMQVFKAHHAHTFDFNSGVATRVHQYGSRSH